MNTPNKLTVLRVLLIPFFVAFMMMEPNGWNKWAALAVFVIASVTDWLDGYLARRDHLVTNFGKFMDPLADKLLVLTALIYLVERGKLVAFGFGFGFAVTIILAREFAVTGLRLLAANNNCVIAASKLGKSKTVSQMLMIILLIINCYPLTLIGGNIKDIVTVVLVSIVTILTIVSGVDYFAKNISVLKEKKEV